MEFIKGIIEISAQQGVLSIAFLIGVVAFILAIIGKPPGNETIPPLPRIILGVVGVVLALVGIVGVILVSTSQESDTASVAANSSIDDAVNMTLTALTVVSSATQEVPLVSSSLQASPTVPDMNESTAEGLTLFRPHETGAIGTGVFTNVSSSDGLAPFTAEDLSTFNYRIQAIRQEEYPSGCAESLYDTDRIWFGGSVDTLLTLNDQEVGKLGVSTGSHGFIVFLNVDRGDKLCAIGYDPSGFHIYLGPDIYYHYDSYCYRGNC